MSPIVSFEEVRYEIRGKEVLRGLCFDVEAGETLALLGRSGSGKTTALKMVNRLVEPSAGRVVVEDVPTTEWNPIQLRRRIGYVIQEVGLFPHLTVAANVGLVPELEGWATERIAARVDELLDPRRAAGHRLPPASSERVVRRRAAACGRGPGAGRRSAYTALR